MTKEDFIIIIPMLLLPILMIGLFVFVYLLNRDEFKKNQIERERLEVEHAKPYEEIINSKNKRIPSYIKPLSTMQFNLYLLYFFIAIVTINIKFGVISYGPNLPYTISLIVVGIPVLVFFCHVIVNADNQRNRLLRSGISQSDASNYFAKWLVFPLLAILGLISLFVELSNEVFRK